VSHAHIAGWVPIEQAEDMVAYVLFHEYYSHGCIRHGYRNRMGKWRGINADGTDGPLSFDPEFFQHIPKRAK